MKKLFFYAGSLLISLSTCQNAEKTDKSRDTLQNKKDSISTSTSSKDEVQVTENPEVNHLAQFISGQKPSDNGFYDSLTKAPFWKSYAQNSDNKWSKIKQGKFKTMQQWANEELKEVNQKTITVFYPFSGADFIHADLFFPEADRYVFIGLEPPGSLPDLRDASPSTLSSFFTSLDQAMYHLVSLSFFRTLSMEVDLTGRRNKLLNGTLPLFMIFMNRLDYKVLNVDKIAISPSGNLQKAENLNSTNNKKDTTIYGVRIYFKKANEEKVKKMYYFGVDLSNHGLSKRPELLKFLKDLDFNTTYLKSASYLMYHVNDKSPSTNFRIIRDLILEKTSMLLQDDSGMPISNFSEQRWDLTFYGSYFAPISLFSNWYQKDLRKIYQDNIKVKPLPFGIGYQYKEGTSNLMLAIKK